MGGDAMLRAARADHYARNADVDDRDNDDDDDDESNDDDANDGDDDDDDDAENENVVVENDEGFEEPMEEEGNEIIHIDDEEEENEEVADSVGEDDELRVVEVVPIPPRPRVPLSAAVDALQRLPVKIGASTSGLAHESHRPPIVVYDTEDDDDDMEVVLAIASLAPQPRANNEVLESPALPDATGEGEQQEQQRGAGRRWRRATITINRELSAKVISPQTISSNERVYSRVSSFFSENIFIILSRFSHQIQTVKYRLFRTRQLVKASSSCYRFQGSHSRSRFSNFR